MTGSERASLLRWGGWFFLAIGLLLCAIGIRYLTHFPLPQDPIAILYTALAFVSHFCAIALAVWILAIVPMTIAFPSRKVVLPVAVVLGGALLAGLLVDSLVFAQNRFHLSALALQILGWRTWAFGALYLAIFVPLCAFVARWVWRRCSGRSPLAVLGALVLAPFLTTQALHIWADAQYYVPITSFTPYLPLFRPWVAKHLVARWIGVVDLKRARDAAEIAELASPEEGMLHYPLAPLRCAPPDRRLNVVLIGVDSMRADANQSRLTPNIFDFSLRAIRFENHFSAGNGTRPGLFSIFYGLPPTYWTAFYSAQRSPVLVDEFQAAGYQMGVFPGNPPDKILGLDRTAFRNVQDLPSTRDDVELTKRWLEWLDRRDAARPFFGFLFYESAPGGCVRDPNWRSQVPPNAPPLVERRVCYDVALRLADELVGEVLRDLERRGLMEQTVIILTSDHGEEFDENGLGFSGHGSSYSEYQLRAPMAIRWPGRSPFVVSRRTSHYDVAPTLLGEVLGCANPPSDYASGRSLLSDGEWSWLVAASYTGFAIVEPDRVTISSGAYFEVRDRKYRVIEDPHLDHDLTSAAIHETSRFYRR
jgi:membrane-anchored protein YejM (alkaline phosphatase superfamily)